MKEEKEKSRFQEMLETAWKKFKQRFLEWNAVREKYWRKYHINKIILLVFLTVTLLVTTYLYVGAKQTNVLNLKSNLEQTTEVYDVKGEMAGTFYDQKGTNVSIENISPYIQEAVVASEDRRFYSHRGFDPMGILRAGVGYIINFGEIVGGGSTITQQVAKNAYLSADQTLMRKVKELFLAIEIEKAYSKDDILAMYLNNAYFGNGVWGVEDASHKYFGKSASDVTISEAATLSGVLPSPSSMNPIDNYENAINRRDTVLMLMEDQGLITAEERSAADNSDLALNDTYQGDTQYNHPYYFDAVIDEAISKYGFDEEELLNNGYKIYTNLDQTQQDQMDAVYTYDGLFPNASDGTPVESASVALNPSTGGISAVIGGRGEHTFRGYNRATQMERQPGSIIKPLAVYTAALEKGYEMDSLLPDQEIAYGPEEYVPYNVDKTFSEDGEVPMYEAVARSLNAPAVWLLNEIGLNTGIRKAEKFGIDFSKDDRNLAAVALGGMSEGVTPLEMASAYSVFVNEGRRVEPHFINQIVDSTGKVIVDNTNPSSTRVTTPSVAADMNSMLLEVFGPMGTAGNYQPDGYTVAGKTGTTDARFETGVTDKWLVGYTPDLVVTGWIGFDQPSEVHSLAYQHNIGEIVELELEALLPYTTGTAFATSNAGALVENDVPSFDWSNVQEGVSGFVEGVQEGFGSISDQFQGVLDKIAP